MSLMFKNNVFKVSVDTKKWFKKAGVRAVKTIAQSMLTLIGSDMINIVSLDWKYIIGASAVMGLTSILTSIVGIPEVEAE